MRTRTTIGATLVALSGAAGCSQRGSGVSLDDMPSQIANAYCAKVYECCSGAELAGRQSEGPDEKSCRLHNAVAFAQIRDQVRASNDKHRAVYRGDQMQACVTALKAAPCSSLKTRKPGELAACDRYIEPLVAAGGACGFDHDCVASSCEGEQDGVDGVCTARVGDGQPCETASCADGFYCENRTCRVLQADGESCGANYQCNSGGCNGNDADAGVAGVCGPKGGTGTTCFLTTGCSTAPGAPRQAGRVTAFVVVIVAALGLARRRRTRPPQTAFRSRPG